MTADPTTAKTVIVGDVHGCTHELRELLEQVHFDTTSDRLVLVGDVIARGPDSAGALALARALGAQTLRGNHEHKLLAWRRLGATLGEEHARVAKSLSEDDWRMLESMPLFLDLPDHDIRVVHAGTLPGLDVQRTAPEALLTMRTIDPQGRWSERPDAGPLWGSLYQGPPHVIFGHNARPQPQFHIWATGIDTGCVYGGRLTALTLKRGERVGRGEALRANLTSVRALRKYYGGPSGPLSRGSGSSA